MVAVSAVDEARSCFPLWWAAASVSNLAKAVLALDRSPELSALATLAMSVCAWLLEELGLEAEVELVALVAACEAVLEAPDVAEALSICNCIIAACAACVLLAFSAAARAARSFAIFCCALASGLEEELVEDAAETELMGF